MDNELVRFSVAMPDDLLKRLDEMVERRGTVKNRSEVIRDLVRDALNGEDSSLPGTEVMGSLTIVYDHHASSVQERLHEIQHEQFGSIVSTTHVHLNTETCLEVILIRGENDRVREVADRIRGTKGVKNGGLVITATGRTV